MRTMLTTVAIALCASSLWCQDIPKAEVFGGYSYVNIDTNNLSARQNANGWETSVSGNFNKWFAAEFDVNGYYKTYSISTGGLLSLPPTVTIPVRDYSYLAGPRFNFRPLFVHALIGGDHLSASGLGLTASQDSLAGAFGGGVEVPVNRLISFRVSADYVFTRHNILGGPSVTQNNVRASAGIVFNLGRRRSAGASVMSPSATPQPVPNTSEAALLGVVGYATDYGLKVTSVQAGSPAEKIFIKPGDVISKIDGKDVKNGRDIESAVAASTTGTIKVSGFTQAAIGMISFEREIKVR